MFRNDPCPCGSGKKFRQCRKKKQGGTQPRSERQWPRKRRKRRRNRSISPCPSSNSRSA
ncbi:MAG: SEC-C metal-binding domain-containing protein [Thermoguttaceae bacterium]